MRRHVLLFVLLVGLALTPAALALPPGYTYQIIEPDGATYSTAQGINGAGDIVGSFVDAGGAGHGFLYSFDSSSGLFTYKPIDVPGARSIGASSINDGGDIVGSFTDAFGVTHGFQASFDSRSGHVTYRGPIDVPGASATFASSINNGGDIVGSFQDPLGALHGFFFSGGTYKPIDVTPADLPGAKLGTTQAVGINDVLDFLGGAIVGFYEDLSFLNHGFLFSGGKYKPIDVVIPGVTAQQTRAYGINNSNAIVGDAAFEGVSLLRGFLQDMTGKFQLLTITDAQGLHRTQAFGINMAGQIVGQFRDAQGHSHGFLATQGCQLDVTQLPQGQPDWADNHYDETAWITQDFATADHTAVTMSHTLELVVKSTTCSIPISDKNNNLNGLRDAINNCGKGVQASVLPRKDEDENVIAHYLSVKDTIGAVCQVCDDDADLLQLRETPGDPNTDILEAETIGSKGCYLTSLSMAINFVATKKKLTGLPSNPDVLNGFMIKSDLSKPGDYGQSGAVNPKNTINDISNTYSVKLNWNDKRLNSIIDPVSSTASQYLDDVLCTQRLPIIVGVKLNAKGKPGHFVLVTGKQVDAGGIVRYTIADPGPSDNKFLDQYQTGQYPTFETRGFVSDPAPNSALTFSVGDPVDLLVTDPNGKRTGFDATTGQRVEEIPNSVHFRDGLEDDVTGAPPKGTDYSVNISQPLDGTYTVVLDGFSLGTYTLVVRPFSEDRSAQPSLLLKGIAAQGSTSTFQIQFASWLGATSRAVRVATFQSTLDDISNSLQLGLIDNQDIATSLSQKIRNAEDAAARGQTQTARNILGAFKNEVNAQTGKHITEMAAQILLQDADSLLSQLQ